MEPSIAWWDWVGIGLGIIGTIGFLMAVEPILVRWFTAPKISIGTRDGSTTDCKTLECTLQNKPITHGLLRTLRIQRMPAADALTTFEFIHFDNQQNIFWEVPKLNTAIGSLQQRIALPASPFPAFFTVVFVEATGKVFALSNDGDTTNVPAGLYTAKMSAVVDGETYELDQDFVVQAMEPFAYWLEPRREGLEQ